MDGPFRIALLVGLLSIVPIGLYHRLEAHATREKLDRSQEGVFMLATLRPLGLIFWAAAVVWLVDPESMVWSRIPLPVWLRWCGAGLMGGAAALLFWTFHCLGRNLTDTVVTRREHTMVAQGPYRWVRHPFYDTAALLVISIVLMTANGFFLITGSMLIGLLVIRTPIEEANLLNRFGDGYRGYMARTGRFLPKVRKAKQDTP